MFTARYPQMSVTETTDATNNRKINSWKLETTALALHLVLSTELLVDADIYIYIPLN